MSMRRAPSAFKPARRCFSCWRRYSRRCQRRRPAQGSSSVMKSSVFRNTHRNHHRHHGRRSVSSASDGAAPSSRGKGCGCHRLRTCRTARRGRPSQSGDRTAPASPGRQYREPGHAACARPQCGARCAASPEPPSPPRTLPQPGDDSTESGRLAGGDPLGRDRIGKVEVETIDLTPFFGE